MLRQCWRQATMEGIQVGLMTAIDSQLNPNGLLPCAHGLSHSNGSRSYTLSLLLVVQWALYLARVMVVRRRLRPLLRQEAQPLFLSSRYRLISQYSQFTPLSTPVSSPLLWVTQDRHFDICCDWHVRTLSHSWALLNLLISDLRGQPHIGWKSEHYNWGGMDEWTMPCT